MQSSGGHLAVDGANRSSREFRDGFVTDQLLQQHGRRIPVHPRNAQKTGVEPGLKQVVKIIIDLLEFAIFGQHFE